MSNGHKIEGWRQTRPVVLPHVPLFSDELVWQAALMDGEGTITISRQERVDRASPAFRACVSVTNTNPILVAPYVQRWGGKAYRTTDKRKKKKWSDSYTWTCPQLSIVGFLSSIRGFLRAKRKNADLVLEFMRGKRAFKRYHGSTRGAHRGGSAPLGKEEIAYRESLKRQVQLLNAKGQVARKGGAL